MKSLTFLVCLIPSTCFAINQDDLLHGAAHFGGEYVVTHVGEVICTKAVGKEHKLSCSIVSAIVATAANVGYKASQKFPNDTNRAVISGLLGAGLAITIINLDF